MTEPSAPTLHRFRVVYQRGPEMRYVGHLDTQLVWERTMRRARLPVAFTQGYSPRPRFHMASALPLGFTSRCELADLWLNEDIDSDAIKHQLQKAAPPGLVLDTVSEIDLALPALQTQVISAEYIAQIVELPSDYDLNNHIQRLLNASNLPRTRRDKPYDLRPLIEELGIVGQSSPGDFLQIRMLLSAREGATGRPDEVLSEMGLDPSTARVERTRLILS